MPLPLALSSHKCGPLGNEDDGIWTIKSESWEWSKMELVQVSSFRDKQTKVQSKSTWTNFKHNPSVTELRSELRDPDSPLSVQCICTDSLLMQEKSSSPWNIRKDAYLTITGLWGYFQTHCISFGTQTPHWVQFSFVLRRKLTSYET